MGELGRREPFFAVMDPSTDKAILLFPARPGSAEPGHMASWTYGYGPAEISEADVEKLRLRMLAAKPSVKQRLMAAITVAVKQYSELHITPALIAVRGDTPAYRKVRTGGV